MSPDERNLVRELARRVAEIAALPIQTERIQLWKDLNALRPQRAMVLRLGGPVSSHSKARKARGSPGSDTATTAGTARASASRSQSRPAASALNMSGGALALVFTKRRPPPASRIFQASLMSPPATARASTIASPTASPRALRP